MVGAAGGATPRQRDERARPRRRLALHAAREPGLRDGCAARREADREGARQPSAPKRDPGELALGSILCAYALDSALFGLHHVICQALVRVLRHPARGDQRDDVAACGRGADPARRAADDRARAGAGRQAGRAAEADLRSSAAAGADSRSIGADREHLGEAVEAIMARPELQMTPDCPDEARDPRADRQTRGELEQVPQVTPLRARV